MKRLLAVSVAVLGLGSASVRADEGMWVYNNFPKEKVKAKYGFAPSDQWLTEAQQSSVRLAQGCSGSFVSPNGLVMTNHHCAHSCIEQLSTEKKDFVKSGFYAAEQKDEVKCPLLELNQLTGISDVTARVQEATVGKEGKEFAAARRAIMSRLEKECSAGDEKLRCDVVSLYHGGKYDLYKYKRFQDVRLVFAPEFAIAFFGGDPDNFNFPRYDLDVSFIRAYEDGKPFQSQHHFKWSKAGAQDKELTFVSGHPGGTDRNLTVAELEYQRDVALPTALLGLAEYRGALTMFTKSSPEHYRIAEAELFGVENGFKAIKGRFEALLERKLFDEKAGAEKLLRAKVSQDPEMQKKYGAAWDEIGKALAEYKKIRKSVAFIEGGAGVRTKLFGIARTLVRYPVETQKPNEKRLREFSDSALPQLKHGLFTPAPIYDDFEVFRVTYSLTKLREELGADDPFVKKVLGKKSPEDLAKELVLGSKLKDLKVRKALFDGGSAAIEASTDPMILLARALDPGSRELRKKLEDGIEASHTRNSELVAKARFETEGTSNYPDATFTLRLSYGAVRGYEENGHKVDPLTYLGGAFERATGREPFELPKSWNDAKGELKLGTPMNMATDTDIIGGNSGSPVFNKDLEIVGLIFDGNIQSLGGEYFFDESVNRAVSVHSEALTEALEKIYKAERIVNELKQQRSGSPAGME